MTASIAAELRKLVGERAKSRCEYCLIPQKFCIHRHEPDHIVPVQHGGDESEKNLALACMRCNRFKGPNVGSFDPDTGKLTPFFHPRNQKWSDHFEIQDALILPKTPAARVTVKIFRFNDEDRVAERRMMIEAGLFDT